MNIRIQPSVLEGTLSVPSSKSCSHRALICAALADGESVIKGISSSKDIEATISAMTAAGAEFVTDGDTVRVRGIGNSPKTSGIIDCCESGSTLRFIIPVAAALGMEAQFTGQGRLPERPLDIFTRELSAKGISFTNGGKLPFTLSGKLQSGIYTVEGNVSSQFVTGLLFALPLLNGDSEIHLTSHLESKPYIDITASYLRCFGIEITETENGYHVRGGQHYTAADCTIEGDYSQAAFFYTANALGSRVTLENLDEKSVQGDKKILEIIREMCYNNKHAFNADCSDIPDLVPILAVLGCFGDEPSVIYNAERLRIKESDRLAAISDTLNRIGGDVRVTDGGLVINPIKSFTGGEVSSHGDHRIVMAAAIAALRAENDVIIRGAEAVEKSYPAFFADYNKLGGKANVIILE